MKNLLLVFAAVMLISASSTEPQERFSYCYMIVNRGLRGVNIELDLGQERGLLTDMRLKDAEGAVKKFDSVIDALNYMGQDGWELVIFDQFQGGTRYLLKRRAK